MRRFAILTLCFVFASDASAQLVRSDSRVKSTIKAGPIGADGKQTVELLLKIDPGWYIYANPIGHEDFVDYQVTVRAIGVKEYKVEYPGSAAASKEFGDYRLKVFDRDTTIAIELIRIPGEPATLRTVVNAAKGEQCPLLPGALVNKLE